MPEQTVVTWTCTRCRAKREFEHGSGASVSIQPDDWWRVRSVSPPKAELGGSEILGDLCNSCSVELEMFMRGARLHPQPANGVSVNCGCWYKAPAGTSVGEVVDCPAHGPGKITRCNVDDPLPGITRDDQMWWHP